jgi:hypothetical protein
MSLADQPVNTPRLARVLKMQLADCFDLLRRRKMDVGKGPEC